MLWNGNHGLIGSIDLPMVSKFVFAPYKKLACFVFSFGKFCPLGNKDKLSATHTKRFLWKKCAIVILKPPSLDNRLQQEYRNIARFFKEIIFLSDLRPNLAISSCGWSSVWVLTNLGKKILGGRDYERIFAQNVKIAFQSISTFRGCLADVSLPDWTPTLQLYWILEKISWTLHHANTRISQFFSGRKKKIVHICLEMEAVYVYKLQLKILYSTAAFIFATLGSRWNHLEKCFMPFSFHFLFPFLIPSLH